MYKEKQDLLRKIPSVEKMYNAEPIKMVSERYPRHVVLNAIRKGLDELRENILSGTSIYNISPGRRRYFSAPAVRCAVKYKKIRVRIKNIFGFIFFKV